MQITKAVAEDIISVGELYERIHDAQEMGEAAIGWIRGIYPTRQTAQEAFWRGDLFVQKEGERVIGSAVINQLQVDCYAAGSWSAYVPEDQVMVLHTLVIDPAFAGRGYGRRFVEFYEAYGAAAGCTWLRMDTNEKNVRARAVYRRLGYREVGIVPTVFNNIPDVQLVLLEKRVIIHGLTGS